MNSIIRTCAAITASLLLLVGAASAQAAFVTGAVSISSPQGAHPNHDLFNIINQSGLSATYTSGVTDFDVFAATTTGSGLSGSGFTNTSSRGPQQFTFDLGALYTIDAIALWNSGSSGSITRFEVYSDTDADFGNGTSGLLLAPAALSTSTAPAQVFGFTATDTQFVHINALVTTEPPDY